MSGLTPAPVALTTGAIAFCMAVPLLQPAISRAFGQELWSVAGAGLCLAAVAGVILAWPAHDSFEPGASTRRRGYALIASAAACIVVYLTAKALLPAVFAGPVDVNRGDMLVVTEAGIRRVLAGHTPYTMHHVPWEMALSYGPGLWAPFVLPVVLHVDMRVLTLICFGSVGAALLIAGSRAAANGEWIGAAATVLLAIGLIAHPDLRAFFPTGHTFVYWPLLVLFCAALSVQRWFAAAAILGLLVCARSTMVALVPVFLMAAFVRGRLDWRLCGVLALTSIGPFVPFVIADPASVQYAMYGAYQKTIKGFVWTQTQWVQQTYGVTGVLLRHGRQSWVEPVQIVSLLTVYALAWRSLRRGGAAEPWMGMALLVFSMTTLWPVMYLYFDVWVLLVCAFAFRMSPPPRSVAGMAIGSAVVLAISSLATFAAGASLHGTYDLDVGTPAAAALTGGGFGLDQREVEDGRDYVWIEGTTARVRAPRAGLTSATITIELKPCDNESPRQRLRVSLNGHVVEDGIVLEPGWQTVSIAAPANRWQYGFNVLAMEFSRTSPEPGTGRPLSAAIDRIQIR